MWFDLKPTSMGENKEEPPLLLKKITTLEPSNLKASIYTQKETLTILFKIYFFS